MENNTQQHEILHSYCLYPNVKFETQADNETVLLVLRSHPTTQIYWIINAFIFFLLLIVANFVLPSLFTLSQSVFINLFGIIFIISYLWFNFLNWFFNVGIVTNQRIVDIDYTMIIYKEITATHLEKIEDITAKSGGYFPSLFDYGDVFIQTAGTEANIEFLNVPHPSQVVKIINGLLP